MASQSFADHGTWTILKYGSSKRRKTLIHSSGHVYVYHYAEKRRPYLECVEKSLCNGTVKQFGSTFVIGKRPHHHDPNKNLTSLCQIRHAIAEKDIANPFIPARQIIHKVLSERRQMNLPVPARIRAKVLCYSLCEYRKKHRAYSSDILNFSLNNVCLPQNFVQVDLKVYGHNMILGTQHMVKIMYLCKHWYVDCHEHFVKEPAILMSISSILKNNGAIVHEPLLYCILSNSNKRNFRVVFKCILKLLNGSPSVTDVTLGFDKALWRVVCKLLSGVNLHGCVYAFRQQL